MAVAIARGGGDGDRLARVGKVGRNRLGDVLHGADLHDSGLGLLEDELFVDGADLGLLFVGLFAARPLFFGGGQWNVMLEMANAGGVISVNFQGVLVALKVDTLTLRVNLMLAGGLVPLGDGRILVHVLDDLAPADAGVVRAERNFALLSGIGNDAHLGAAEVIVKQILKPHAADEEEVPAILLSPLPRIFIGAVGRSAAVFRGGFLRERPGLVEFLE